MLKYIKNAWLKHKINNASLLKHDDSEHPFQFITSFMKKHPEYDDEDDVEVLIKEYKDFMYLAATSEDECTPSKAVDDIWHHHILHTKDYLEHWCGNVIGKVIHHNPEKPGDTKNYNIQFENTNKKLAEVRKPKKVRSQKLSSDSKIETITYDPVVPTDNSENDALLNTLLIHSVLDTPSNDNSHSSESSHSSCSSSSSSSCSSSSSSCSSSSSSCSSSSCGGGGGD